MLILAQGRVAEKPYEMPYTGKRVYTIEELCCYIYNNIYTINEDFFQIPLADWLRDQTDLPELADKLVYMIGEEHGLKDLVVTILCGCDYYREDEVRKIVKIMDEIANLPVYKKKKIKADNYLRAGRYGRSLTEYRKLLHGSFAVNFTPEEYGDILHNMGISHFYTSSFEQAKEDFKEAYVRNHKKDSLQHYLWILLMEEEEALFEKEAVTFGLASEEIHATRMRYQEAAADFRLSEDTESRIDEYKEQMRTAYAG
jgi:tetratricopeptide (TPR) repeat protein